MHRLRSLHLSLLLFNRRLQPTREVPLQTSRNILANGNCSQQPQKQHQPHLQLPSLPSPTCNARTHSRHLPCSRSLSSLPVYLFAALLLLRVVLHRDGECGGRATAGCNPSFSTFHKQTTFLYKTMHAHVPLADEVVVGPPQHVLEPRKLFVRDDTDSMHHATFTVTNNTRVAKSPDARAVSSRASCAPAAVHVPVAQATLSAPTCAKMRVEVHARHGIQRRVVVDDRL